MTTASDSIAARDFALPRRRSVALALLAVAAALAGAAQGEERDGKIRIPAEARVGTAALKSAEFEFACHAGKGGTLALSAIVPPPESVSAFPLDLFEGPDGVGESRPLAAWSLAGHGDEKPLRSTISGWRGVDGDGYVMSTARPSAKRSDLARFAAGFVGAEESSLRLVVDAPRGDAILEVEGAPGERREAIARVLAPCLRDAK